MNSPLLITTPTNIRYLTGFTGAVPEEREAYVLWVKDQLYLFTNVLYVEEARQLKQIQDSRCMIQELKVVEISRENPLSKKLKEIIEAEGITELDFEEDNLTVAELKKLKKELKKMKIIGIRGKIEELRILKQTDEIASMRIACELTDKAYDFTMNLLKPGVTEQEIAWEMEAFIRKNGGQLAFPSIVAFGANGSKPHYSGNAGVLQQNDMVLLDFGAKTNGYCADMTRMVFIGTPKKEWTDAYNTVLASQEKALSLLKSGTRNGATLDAAAKKVIAEAGLPPYPHSLGHGLGLDIHEAPRLSVKKDAEIKPGMVVTVEPGVYLEGQFGIRIEDTILIQDNTIELLTKTTKEIAKV